MELHSKDFFLLVNLIAVLLFEYNYSREYHCVVFEEDQLMEDCNVVQSKIFKETC